MIEEKRIEALKKFEVLDTPPDGSFDSIVELATRILKVPIAIISLVDEDRIWFLSKVGLDVQEIDRKPGLCASAILTDEVYVVEDARKDPRSLANPLVAGEFGLQFYAAAPLSTGDGHNLGTLCVIDKEPRVISKEDKLVLKNLADLVMRQMELRREAREAVLFQTKLAHLVTHNLKGFSGNIPTLIKELRAERNNDSQFDLILNLLENESKKNFNEISEFLEQAARQESEIVYNFKRFEIGELVASVVLIDGVLAKRKNQTIEFKRNNAPLFVRVDKNKMMEAVSNLINNAINYSPFGGNILVEIQQTPKKAIIVVTDQAKSLTEADQAELFKRFNQLSMETTGGEVSTGVGLWIAKIIVEDHKGAISAKSTEKDRGNTYTIELNLE